MKYVKVDKVIDLHEKLIERYGGSKGIRDNGLLISSIESVFQTYGGDELYPTDIDKIVQASFSLVKNHCFIDGNKRIGMMLLLYLLEINNFKHKLNNEDIIKLGLELASGEMTKEDFKTFIENKIIND